MVSALQAGLASPSISTVCSSLNLQACALGLGAAAFRAHSEAPADRRHVGEADLVRAIVQLALDAHRLEHLVAARRIGDRVWWLWATSSQSETPISLPTSCGRSSNPILRIRAIPSCF